MFSFTNLLLQPSKYIRPYLTTSIRTQCFGVDVVAKWIKPLLKTDHSILECQPQLNPALCFCTWEGSRGRPRTWTSVGERWSS